MSLVDDFINKVAPAAMKTQVAYGIPASITIAQAGLESGWGKSKLTREANNFFGIKADKNWLGDAYQIATGEYKDGQYYVDKAAKFRSYNKAADSFQDHAEFLLKNKRYKDLFNSYNPDDWAKGLQKAGYSTSPTYADTLKGEIKKYDLKKFDEKANKMDTTGDAVLRHYRRNRIIYFTLGTAAVLGTAAYFVHRYHKKHGSI